MNLTNVSSDISILPERLCHRYNHMSEEYNHDTFLGQESAYIHFCTMSSLSQSTIFQVLKFLKQDHHDIPYIFQYCQDAFEQKEIVSISKLWDIDKYDKKWTDLHSLKGEQTLLTKQLKQYKQQYSNLDSSQFGEIGKAVDFTMKYIGELIEIDSPPQTRRLVTRFCQLISLLSLAEFELPPLPAAKSVI